MSNIDKQASQVSRYDLVSGYMQKWPDGEFVYHSDYQALLDELEAKDRRNAELNSTLERWAVDRAQSASELDEAEKRIAELETLARGMKQFSEFQICHYGTTEDYAKGYIDCQNNYNKVLFAAAGKGEAS